MRLFDWFNSESEDALQVHPDWTDQKIDQAQQESGLDDAVQLSSYMQANGLMV